MGIYSKKIKDLQELKDGAKIAIPNDDSNWPRALMLLEDAKLITLVDDFNGQGGADKIKDNPKKLEIVPVQSANIPRILDDVDAGVIINGTALEAGYTLSDSLFHESEEATPYVNVIASTEETSKKKQKEFEQLNEIYHSKEVSDYILEKYKGNFIPVERSIEAVLADYNQ